DGVVKQPLERLDAAIAQKVRLGGVRLDCLVEGKQHAQLDLLLLGLSLVVRNPLLAEDAEEDFDEASLAAALDGGRVVGHCRAEDNGGLRTEVVVQIGCQDLDEARERAGSGNLDAPVELVGEL